MRRSGDLQIMVLLLISHGHCVRDCCFLAKPVKLVLQINLTYENIKQDLDSETPAAAARGDGQAYYIEYYLFARGKGEFSHVYTMIYG